MLPLYMNNIMVGVAVSDLTVIFKSQSPHHKQAKGTLDRYRNVQTT